MVVSNTPNITNPDFSAVLRQRRRDLDLTRTELARRVGCSPDTIKKLEEGERRPSKELAELLAEHLQIDTSSRANFILLARTRGALMADIGPSNLPAPLTSFIGRESDAAHIESLLRRGDVRLLTLMGPPGVGKSRLALYVAERLRLVFPDGVWFVPLAAVEDPQQVLLLIAQTLEITDEGRGTPLEWLTNALRNRRMLLVLDNFEQILDAAPYVTALLTACAQLSAIITSRTPLEVYGEHQLVVQPLPVPPAPIWEMPLALDDYESVQLFVARIRAHNPTFSLTAENSAAVAELCVRLDGIPLAIELASGLTRAESPRLLLADVAREGRLALLTTTQRDRTARQQTLREAIAWSVRRLSPADQLLFARLGVFHGTFDLAAAHAVAGVGENGAMLPLNDFSTRLQALAASHIVQLQSGKDGPRYRLLETLREYALETLQAAGETLIAQRRHAQHFAALAFAIDPAQMVGNLHAWRDQLRPDYPNLIAALQFALTLRDVELTLKLASGLGHFWYLEGGWQEGVHWLTQALELPGGPASIRARVKTELGIIYCAWGRLTEAEFHLNQAREEATKAGDLLATAWTLAQLGQTALLLGQAAVTRAYTHERLQIYRRLGDTRYLALTLEQIGCAAVEEGDYERGIPWMEECQSLWESQKSTAGVAAVRLIIGMAELAQGNATSALARFLLAYEEFDSIQHSHGLPWSLRNLGLAYLALGQLPQAQFSLLRSLERYTALTGSENSSIIIVEAAAGIATRLGQHHLAAHLMGAALVSREQVHMPTTENSRQIYERLLAPSIRALGETGWEQAVAVGSTLLWAEAIASARALLDPQTTPQNKTAAPSSKGE
jgi:predicted ATPase/DNA-binding XRE family transcriptional regulator